MISNKKILQEIDTLKTVFKQGDSEIPTMWACFWPGMMVMAWMIGWPLILYGYKIVYYELPGVAPTIMAAAVVWSFFFGLIIMLQVVNGRALYLSIPHSFRETSVLCRFVSTKFRRYLFTYLVTYAVLIILCSSFVYGGVYSIVGLFVLTFSFMIYMNVDLNRYQLKALTTLLESVKGGANKSKE